MKKRLKTFQYNFKWRQKCSFLTLVLIVESIARIRRMYYVNGKGIRAIGRELNISKNTVKKVIRSDATKFELAKYTKSKPALGGHLVMLKQLLEENKKRTGKKM